MEMKLNYSLNEEDIDTFVENLYKYSKYDKKQKSKVISIAIAGPILITVLIDKLSPGTPAGIYILLIIGGFFLMYKTGLDDIKRDNKKAVIKKKEGFVEEKETILTNDSIKIIFINNQKKEITNLWQEVDFYIRENENIFIYAESKNVVHQLKSGSKTDEVEDFLKDVGVTKKV
ncbi:AtpZ/AtpI family protein [Virgibacillus halodenitrificans]|uniref:AtpZ/AtpI family protein n=1 Tax=Virgibacillus halodenitrificans TaxID=1482 RepID=UPI000EF4FD2C|nr:AtpZ/AtpI family protein [Virgibacillus halodenitrificans]